MACLISTNTYYHRVSVVGAQVSIPLPLGVPMNNPYQNPQDPSSDFIGMSLSFQLLTV